LLGSELVQFALIWWLAKTGGSATTLAIAALVGLAPSVALGPFRRRLGRSVEQADGDESSPTCRSPWRRWRSRFSSRWRRPVSPHVYAAMCSSVRLGGAFHWPANAGPDFALWGGAAPDADRRLNQAMRGMAGIAMPPLAALLLVAVPISTPPPHRHRNRRPRDRDVALVGPLPPPIRTEGEEARPLSGPT
jgi:DHA3 family macrolide efflux protein-like MFS transporter